MDRTASFDESCTYRHSLARRWADGDELVWVMLNPSTADHRSDDPTIRRCIGFSRGWGFGALRVLNLFDLRATDPRTLRSHPEPESPANADQVARAIRDAAWVVAGWGAQGSVLGRSRTYERLLDDGSLRLRCLGVTQAGHPRHPLYVRSDRQHEEWRHP